MMESRKRNRLERMVSLLLGVAILFGGSLSVCAYENPQVIRDADAVMFEALQDEKGTWGVTTEEIQFSEEEVLDFVEFLGDDGISYN